MATSTIRFAITDEDRERLDKLAEHFTAGSRCAYLRATLPVMESIARADRLHDIVVIAEDHAAARDLTEDGFLDEIKTCYKGTPRTGTTAIMS